MEPIEMGERQGLKIKNVHNKHQKEDDKKRRMRYN